LKTGHYNLEVFGWGDTYSASADRRRFNTIDNQLAFLSDTVGDGRIYGWSMSEDDATDLGITVSPGMGIINRRVARSFGNLFFTVQNNSTNYIYMKALIGENGGVSYFSNITGITHTDLVPPSRPTGLKQVNSLISYNQVGFTWDENDEIDFSYYIIRRTDDSVYIGYKNIAETIAIAFTDTGLIQDTEYEYEVIAVDLSGNLSDGAIITISTAQDNRIPSNPLFVQTFAGDETVQVIWDHSSSDNVESYRVQIKQTLDPLDIVKDIVVAANSSTGFNSTSTFFSDLSNGTTYQAIVYTINVNGYTSDGVFTIFKPSAYTGPAEVTITDSDIEIVRSTFENVGLETNLSWIYEVDPYKPFPEKFKITFLENGVRSSEDVIRLESEIGEVCSDATVEYCYSTNIKFIPFKNDSGDIYYESLKEYTPYLIKIQTEDEDGNISNGVVIRVNRTPTYQVLPAVSNVVIERKINDDVYVSWDNPPLLYFNYNRVTCTITDLTQFAEEDEVYLDDVNIGKANSFVVPNIYFDVNKRYNIKITTVDVFDIDGIEYNISKNFTEADIENASTPRSPIDINLDGNNGSVLIIWKPSPSQDIEYYNIYRAEKAEYLTNAEFSLLIQIPSSLVSYTDYEVINGITYEYIITSVNKYGYESESLSDNPFLLSSLFTTPSSPNTMIPPENIVVSQVGSNSAKIEWIPTDGQADGYEIYRSIGDKYSFESIGYVDPTESLYVDTDILLKDSTTYYYMVRKFVNEVEIFSTASTVTLSNSIILGTVIVSNRNITIDETLAVELLNLEDPMRELTRDALLVDRHLKTDFIDRRIELRSSASAIDWTTNNFQVYKTDKDIRGATEYIVRISGTIDENYFVGNTGVTDVVALRQAQSGISPIVYEVDSENGVLTFTGPLYTECVEVVDPLNLDAEPTCPKVPYSTEPVISLEMVNISEVDGILPADKVENLSATQMASGQITTEQMPVVKHEGRIDEDLIPMKLPMGTIDNVVYSLANVYEEESRNKMGEGVTFYDIIRLVGDTELLAATSSGIWYSGNNGNDWEKKKIFTEAVYKLFRSSDDRYFALTNYGVYLNTGSGYGTWEEMGGLSSVKIIRDVVEDVNGDIFISTDLGVYRLNEFKPYLKDTWEQLSIFGVRSTEAYGMLYDADSNPSFESEGKIIVGNELGLLESIDGGNSWNYTPKFADTASVKSFVKKSNYIFALTNDAVYRQGPERLNFVKIVELDVGLARKIYIFNDKIYIITDKGPFVSNGGIYDKISSENDYIEFVSTWASIGIRDTIPVVTSLNKIEDDFFIGSDKRLYIFDWKEKLWLQYEQRELVVPTIYVNGVVQVIGFYYNNGGTSQNISFDERLPIDTEVEIANRYDIYHVEYGGWSENKYDSKFIVKVNDSILGESPDNIQLDLTQFSAFVFPFYTDINAHKEKADLYKSQVELDIDILTGLEPPTGTALVDLITSIYNNLERFLSQLYTEARISIVDGKEVPVILPKINIETVVKDSLVSSSGEVIVEEANVGATVNAVTGIFIFDNSFDKYDRLRIDIYDCLVKNIGGLTHREVEDSMEQINSGLPSSLSQVQQINIDKLNIFTERTWPGEQAELSPAYQSESIVPVAGAWYDTLNSTINYNEEVYEKNVSFSILYPSDVLFIEEKQKVLVGGRNGVLSIKVDNLEISEVDVADFTNQMVKQIYQRDNYVYIITDKNIYESTNYGLNWSLFNRLGLPNILCRIGFVANNMVIGAEDGLYYKSSSQMDWAKARDSSVPVEVISDPDLLFAVIDGSIHITGDGYNYTDLGIGSDLNISVMKRFKSAFYVATDIGLYTDSASFYGQDPKLYLIDVEENSAQSGPLSINDLYSNSNNLLIGISNGSYYLMEGGEFNFKEFTRLDAIHQVLIVNNNIWLFGYDLLEIPDTDYPIRLSTGVPL